MFLDCRNHKDATTLFLAERRRSLKSDSREDMSSRFSIFYGYRGAAFDPAGLGLFGITLNQQFEPSDEKIVRIASKPRCRQCSVRMRRIGLIHASVINVIP